MRKHNLRLHLMRTPGYTREVTQWTEDDELASEWHDLMGRYHRMTCALDRSLTAKHGLSGSDFEVLQQLYSAGPECGAQVKMSELGERVHLSQSAFSRLISRLEQSGLVERSICADDRRSAMTCITEAGKQRYLEARPTQRAILRGQGAEDTVPDHASSAQSSNAAAD
jgi:DNA-binding MarR family transcriptional regulator